MNYVSYFFETEGKRKVYLDVETDLLGRICVIGIAKRDGQFFQFYGEDIIFQNVERVISDSEVVVTFNGDRFDLPLIKKQLDLDLRASHLSLDLWRIKKKIGLSGGLKEIEIFFGIKRTIKINGYEACLIWERYKRSGDIYALDVVLKYNKEDVLNLIELEDKLLSLLKKTE